MRSWCGRCHVSATRRHRGIPVQFTSGLAHPSTRMVTTGRVATRPVMAASAGRIRAFYRRLLDTFVIGGIGPEAEYDPRGFKRAVKKAEERLDAVKGNE